MLESPALARKGTGRLQKASLSKRREGMTRNRVEPIAEEGGKGQGQLNDTAGHRCSRRTAQARCGQGGFKAG